MNNLAPNHKIMPALCLDWDGTIRQSKTGKFIKDQFDIELLPGIEEKIQSYRDNGFLIIGISNQGGVSFGYKTPKDNDNEIATTLALFNNPHIFDAIKMCYHMEGGTVFPYNVRSLLRKPDIGMLAIAEQDAFKAGFIIDWNDSLFVGDRPEDEECAKNANIKFVHVDNFKKYE